MITIANLKQAKTDDEIKRLTVNSVKTAYHDLALDYNHLLNLDYIYCPHCGKWKSTNGNSNFYRSNKSKSGFEHFACKSCILDLCTDVDPKTGARTDNREKTINTFRQLNWKFSESDYNAQLQTINEGVGEKIRGTAVQNLIVMVASLPQYKNKTYKDSEFAIDDIENNSEENTRIVQKTIKSAKKRFGNNYSNEELMYLETEYQDWINRYPCENKGQEVLYKQICFIELNIDKAQKEGKDTKDLLKSLQDVMSSLQIKPSQNNSNALTEAKTFGQLIAKWETEKPIPEPDEDFKDVDGISDFVDIFMRGHLAKMMGLKNGYSEKYDSYIEQYSAKKHEYTEDETSQSMYDQIFGGDMDE